MDLLHNQGHWIAYYLPPYRDNILKSSKWTSWPNFKSMTEFKLEQDSEMLNDSLYYNPGEGQKSHLKCSDGLYLSFWKSQGV